jgi:hypothetical protein
MTRFVTKWAIITTALAVAHLYGDALSPTQYSGEAFSGASGENITGPGTFTYNSGAVTTTLTLSYTAIPTLLESGDYAYSDGDASITGSGNNGVNGGGESGSVGHASITYYYMVTGSKSEQVPIFITASGAASATSPFNGTAEAQAVLESAAGILCATTVNGGNCGDPGSLAFSNSPLSFDATPGTLYSIVVEIGGQADSEAGEGEATWSASVDPQVEIDPSFADASDFTVNFSPSPVPEPNSVGLIGTALALLGASRWLKRRIW